MKSLEGDRRTIVPKTISFTVIAALQPFSRQLADDFASWMAFVPDALTRAIIDSESDQIVNGDGTGDNMLGLPPRGRADACGRV